MEKTSPERSEPDAVLVRRDWAHSALYSRNCLIGFLIIIGIVIKDVMGGKEIPAEGLLSICVFAAIFFGAAWSVLVRSGRDRPVVAIDEDGIAFPEAGVSRIPWPSVIYAERISLPARRLFVEGVRFHFEPGTLNRRQFGSFHKDRWEVTTSVTVPPFGWQSMRVKGGTDALLSSIDRFVHVED